MTPREKAIKIINDNSISFNDNDAEADNIAISESKVIQAIDTAIQETLIKERR